MSAWPKYVTVFSSTNIESKVTTKLTISQKSHYLHQNLNLESKLTCIINNLYIVFNNCFMGTLWIGVGYNHIISSKHVWNNSFIENAPKKLNWNKKLKRPKQSCSRTLTIFVEHDVFGTNKPMKTLQLHYLMIQVLKGGVALSFWLVLTYDQLEGRSMDDVIDIFSWISGSWIPCCGVSVQ